MILPRLLNDRRFHQVVALLNHIELHEAARLHFGYKYVEFITVLGIHIFDVA